MYLFFSSLVRYRKFIGASTLSVALIVGLASLLFPTWYTATTIIFPPKRERGQPVHADLREELLITRGGATGTGRRPETFYITMMRSERLGLQLVEEFKLREAYGLDDPRDALEELRSRMGYTALVNGLVVITYQDEDAERAAALLNRHVEILDQLNREYIVTDVSGTKAFLAQQIENRKRILEEVELDLRRFKEESQALELDEQFRAAMELVTRLSEEAIELEAELEVAEQSTEPSSGAYVELRREYDALLARIEELKTKKDRNDDLLYSYFPALTEIPALKLELSRLNQRVEVETEVYTRLLTQYEKLRIEEASNVPIVRIMDKASVPNLRSRPRRLALVFIGGLVGLGWSSFFSVLICVWRRERYRWRTAAEVFDPIVNDFSKVFHRR